MTIVVTLKKNIIGPLLLIQGVRRVETMLETKDTMDVMFQVEESVERAFYRLLQRSDQVETWSLVPEKTR
jgi:hypothetical protein